MVGKYCIIKEGRFFISVRIYVTPIELDDFEAKGNDRDRAQAMLTTWADKHHKNAAKRMLILALTKENQIALISDVFGYDSASGAAQSSLPLHNSWGTGKAMFVSRSVWFHTMFLGWCIVL